MTNYLYKFIANCINRAALNYYSNNSIMLIIIDHNYFGLIYANLLNNFNLYNWQNFNSRFMLKKPNLRIFIKKSYETVFTRYISKEYLR